MSLRRIDIKHFRGIRELSLELDEVTVLIGENNTAKTTILKALEICMRRLLNRSNDVFSEYDYHLSAQGSQPADSEPIEITLHFAETQTGEWPASASQRLPNAVQIDEEGRQCLTLRVQSQYNDNTDRFDTTWDFLDLGGDALPNAKVPRYIIHLQELAPVHYLPALRDSAREFRPRSQFWGPFVRALKIEPDVRRELEEALSNLNAQVLDAHHETFEAILERLGRTGQVVPLDSEAPVGIEAIPNRIFDILSRTQVMLTSTRGVRLPIGQHGEGTQSLAVICLYDAFLQSRLAEDTSPILALEEPESHLHPSAIRAVAQLLQNLQGQKIITTHSGDLVSGISLTSLRRLRRQEGNITVHQVALDGSLTKEDMRKIDSHIRTTRGNLLFARCWLLVEGEADRLFMEECARIYGYDLVAESIFPVEYAQVGIATFIKVADQLGIEWLVVADKDSEGSKYLRLAKQQIGHRSEQRHLHQLEHGNLEEFLCMEGYGIIYENNISSQKENQVTKEPGTLDYWKQVVKAQGKNSKPRNISEVITKMEEKGKQGIPPQIQEIVTVALELAREAQ